VTFIFLETFTAEKILEVTKMSTIAIGKEKKEYS